MPIELLAPAGSPEALDAAVGEGADAVYLGLKNFNARMRSANFAYSQFETALRALRRMGKKLYVTVNTVFEQREADRMFQLLGYLSRIGPDALIVQDFGVLEMARAEFPKLKIHASTQMNVASGRGVNMLSRHGVSRVVLTRELSMKELQSIRAETNVELEVFVHGALCVSASGLCLFSSFLGGKSANRGMCTQACRRLYSRADNAAFSGDGSGYYFSPADLQLLEQMPDLAAAGINAVKIEGRMKSADYVGTVTAAYRLALDAIAEGGDDNIRRSIARGQEILRGDFARSKTLFYFNGIDKKNIDWLNPAQDGGTGISLGVIEKTRGSGEERQGFISNAAIRPSVGDSIRLHRRDDSGRVSHKLKSAPEFKAGGYWLSIPEGFDLRDSVYLIQTKALSKKYKPVITGTAAGSRPPARPPGHEKAPQRTSISRNKQGTIPEGLYVAVSRIEDLYVVQSSRPARVMLKLNGKTTRYLLREGNPPLPFKPAEIFLVLDPYFPQAESEALAETVEGLIDRGYRHFVANNLGHFSLFRNFGEDIHLIVGPWLYMFNTWALSFLASLKAEGFISPLENNRQNLERTISQEKMRPMVFVPVFAWPPLFRIRADLGSAYDFGLFTDNRNEKFFLNHDLDNSLVIPETPFSIIDKIPFLKEAGFRRFVIDLSGRPIKKTDYKDLMRAAENGTPLPRVSRFNWKDGFYNDA